ncbi:MAG: group II truncated hemoglobin [Caulobacteraceae bacterium]
MTDAAASPMTLSYPTPFEAIGGEPGVRALVDDFYNRMDRNPAFAALRAIHADDLGPMRDRLTDWLTGWMGGPPVYAERHPGRPCIMSAHAPFRIDALLADQWLACMQLALADSAMPEDWRVLADEAFGRMCQGLRNA